MSEEMVPGRAQGEAAADGTTGGEEGGPARARRGTEPLSLAVIATGVVLGAVILAVGLPEGRDVFGTPAATLTVAAAVLVAMTGVSIAGALTRRGSWRVVDMVVASVLGVVGGFYFWGLAASWEPVTAALKLAPPSVALLSGLWVLPGVVGGLVIRKPGAAVFVELVAAVLEALLGNQWGFATVYYGLIEGLGAEFVLALLFYRSFTLVPALLSGAGAGLAVGLLDTSVAYPDLTAGIKVGYVALSVVSGVVIAGGGAWALTRALARTGALAPLASGRSAERV